MPILIGVLIGSAAATFVFLLVGVLAVRQSLRDWGLGMAIGSGMMTAGWGLLILATLILHHILWPWAPL